MRCDANELRTLFLFESLSDEQLDWLCQNGEVEHLEPGWAHREGEPATKLYVLLDGALVMTQRVGVDDVEVVRSDQRGVYAGAWYSYLGDRVPQVYSFSLQVTRPSRFFVLGADKFTELMREWFPMPVHLLEGLFFGLRNTQQAVGQRERLLALGALSAGLTHELNNPASAAVRATSALRDRVAGMRHKLALIAGGSLDRAAIESLVQLQEEAVDLVAKAPALTPIEASDREERLGSWFEEHRIPDGWDLAPTFVDGGMDEAFLDRVVAAVESNTAHGATLDGAIRWLNYTVETELLMNEIEESTTRVSTLVTATKQYSQMDRAPFQTVDVHELLDSTLLILGSKIGERITVIKDYDRTLPAIPAYAAELNQVWTNLIDNGLAAMAGSGTLTVRTSRDDGYLLVEIGDTGPGVPEGIRDRIFEPFFTTKPFGQGTGLGLDISWRIVVNKHHGDLRVVSVPGDTRFQVRLPFVAPLNVSA
jgi:signal transduction histidine kinase